MDFLMAGGRVRPDERARSITDVLVAPHGPGSTNRSPIRASRPCRRRRCAKIREISRVGSEAETMLVLILDSFRRKSGGLPQIKIAVEMLGNQNTVNTEEQTRRAYLLWTHAESSAARPSLFRQPWINARNRTILPPE